uniref:Uncharacterized protein n=1 Tax=Scophthalmus maximus TaxID=52904 RepID=A0A8D3CFS3_SCOMX
MSTAFHWFCTCTLPNDNKAWKESGVTYSEPPGTCAGRPGRWSCRRCRDTGRQRTPARGCAPRCSYRGSMEGKRTRGKELLSHCAPDEQGPKDGGALFSALTALDDTFLTFLTQPPLLFFFFFGFCHSAMTLCRRRQRVKRMADG